VASCILCALYISFKRVSQQFINCSFKEEFFHVNQVKNFFSHVLKLVFVSIELLSNSAGVSIADEDVTECVLCKEDEDCEVCEEEEKE